MKRVILLAVAAVGAFAGCARALAAARVDATASITVDQRAGINIVTPLLIPPISTTAIVQSSVVNAGSLPSIGSPSALGGSLSSSSVRSGVSPISNATLTIYGQAGDAVSMAVPESFQVVRTGGTETLTVKTNTNSEYGLGGNGVVLGGNANADTMSVNVGGRLTLASNDTATPGPYEGLLVVVVQYN